MKYTIAPFTGIDYDKNQSRAGDREPCAFLQRLCGYCLTGLTNEQQLTFFWGPGGNGKGVFVDVLTGSAAGASRTRRPPRARS